MCKCRVRKIRERLTGDVREVLTGPIRSVQSGTPGCEKGFVKCFLNVPLAYLCSTAAQRPVELSENILQNLFHNLTSQTVLAGLNKEA